jgi:hypothetical protein
MQACRLLTSKAREIGKLNPSSIPASLSGFYQKLSDITMRDFMGDGVWHAGP